jgi:hypothetical protein
MEEDAIKIKQETELREKQIKEENEKRLKERQALMPMHRTLPDFVQVNEKRYNFYEDPKNKPTVIESLKFMKKIRPSYINATTNELLNQKEMRLVVNEPHRVNIFHDYSSGEENDH